MLFQNVLCTRELPQTQAWHPQLMSVLTHPTRAREQLLCAQHGAGFSGTKTNRPHPLPWAPGFRREGPRQVLAQALPAPGAGRPRGGASAGQDTGTRYLVPRGKGAEGLRGGMGMED